MPTRVFLDWSHPLLPSIADRLLPDSGKGPLDLGSFLILTPTKQAGRRLREYLAAEWRRRGGTALLSMQVSPPSIVFQPEADMPVAHAFDWMDAWQQTLLGVPAERLPNLFPVHEDRFTNSSALEFGKRLQKLREELLDAGLDIHAVANRNPMVTEQARWIELASLEAEYRSRLEQRNLIDPTDAKRQSLQTFHPGEGVTRMILAGVPDPSPAIIRRLRELDDDESLTIECWIHAPESASGMFDEWGRPSPDWREEFLGHGREGEGWIEQCADPFSLAERVADILGPAPDHPDLAFGLLHEKLALPITHAMEKTGHALYLPNPVPLSDSPLVRLMNCLQEQRIHNDPESVRALWRQPDLLLACGVKAPEEILKKWDRYAEKHLPVSAEAVSETLADEELQRVWQRMQEALAETTPVAFLTWLRNAFPGETLDPSKPNERFEIRQLGALSEILQTAARREDAPSFAMVLDLLKQETVDPPRIENAVTAEGWLELPYHPASHLILTGLQEGHVPPALTTDPFLPNTLRQELGLKSDRDWIARDAYLFHTLLMSRPDRNVRILTLKRDAEGNPLLPSRYLFSCPRDQMLQRAKLLFQDPPAPELQPAPEEGLILNPERVPKKEIRSISVTAINQYLACPTRFYFRHVLGMRIMDDTHTTPDAGQFGSLIHHVLEKLVRTEPSSEEAWVQRAEEILESRIEDLYGSSRGLPIRVVARSAMERISAAAKPHFELRDQGWKTLALEKRMERDCKGLSIHGIADRIDHHPELGFLLMDYKTSDTSSAPAKTHLGPARPDREYLHVEVENKTRQWINLQLPLYRWLATSSICSSPDTPLRVAYLNLPKAVSNTELASWEMEPFLAPQAEACLESILDHIRNGVWTPTQDPTPYDDFTPLLHFGSDWIGNQADS